MGLRFCEAVNEENYIFLAKWSATPKEEELKNKFGGYYWS